LCGRQWHFCWDVKSASAGIAGLITSEQEKLCDQLYSRVIALKLNADTLCSHWSSMKLKSTKTGVGHVKQRKSGCSDEPQAAENEWHQLSWKVEQEWKGRGWMDLDHTCPD
jgi:hypothetical protein